MAMRSNETVMQYIDRPLTKTIEEAEAWIQIVDDSLNNNNVLPGPLPLLPIQINDRQY